MVKLAHPDRTDGCPRGQRNHSRNRVLESPLVLQECLDLVVGAAQVENQRLTFSLKQEAEIQSTSALHEWHNPAQTKASMKMGMPVREGRRLHHGENFSATIGGDALQKARSG